VAVNPVLPDDVVNEAIPENIRKASEYVHLLEKFTQYLKGRLALRQVIQETPVRPNVVRSVEKTVHLFILDYRLGFVLEKVWGNSAATGNKNAQVFHCATGIAP
jgi:hypothetical protein